MVSGAKDYRKMISIKDAFGYEDKIPVYEIAPATVRYQASPADLADGDWAAALADIKGRPIVKAIIDSISAGVTFDVSDRWARQVGQFDLARYLGSAPSHTNPLHVRISDGAAFYGDDNPLSCLIRDGDLDIMGVTASGNAQTELRYGSVSLQADQPNVDGYTGNYRVLNVLGHLYGWNGTYWDRLQVDASKRLKVLLDSVTGTPTFDISDDTTRELGKVDSLTKWGGTLLTPRDISTDLKTLNYGNLTKQDIRITSPTIGAWTNAFTVTGKGIIVGYEWNTNRSDTSVGLTPDGTALYFFNSTDNTADLSLGELNAIGGESAWWKLQRYDPTGNHYQVRLKIPGKGLEFNTQIVCNYYATATCKINILCWYYLYT